MALLEIGNDLLSIVFEQFHTDKRGAAMVWRLVCKALRDIAPKNQPSWLRAMGVSVSLMDFFCAIFVRKKATYLPQVLATSTLPPRFSTTVVVHGVPSTNYFLEFLIAIAKGGNPNVMLEISNRLNWNSRINKSPFNSKLVYAAAKAGDLDMLTMLLALGLKVGKCAFAGAARGGHARVFNFLLDVRQLSYRALVYPPDEFTFYQKQLERTHTMSRKAQLEGFHCLNWLLDPAIQGGCLCIVMRIAHEIAPLYQGVTRPDYNDPFFSKLAEGAIFEKQAQIFKFAVEQISAEAFSEKHSELSELAAECGSLGISKYLLDKAGDALSTVTFVHRNISDPGQERRLRRQRLAHVIRLGAWQRGRFVDYDQTRLVVLTPQPPAPILADAYGHDDATGIVACPPIVLDGANHFPLVLRLPLLQAVEARIG
jgi:hypothetical protein